MQPVNTLNEKTTFDLSQLVLLRDVRVCKASGCGGCFWYKYESFMECVEKCWLKGSRYGAVKFNVGEHGAYGLGEFRELVKGEGSRKCCGWWNRRSRATNAGLENVRGVEDVPEASATSSLSVCTIYHLWGCVHWPVLGSVLLSNELKSCDYLCWLSVRGCRPSSFVSNTNLLW